MAQLSDRPVHLPIALAEQIIRHAREGKPEEICGVIRGRDLAAFEVIRGKNVAEERIENYTVDPQTLLLQFQFEEQGDEMMGIYHSHPVSVAYPSATDAWNANYPDSIYFICSLEFDDAPVIRAFRMLTHFVELDMAAAKAQIAFYETRPGLFAYYQETKLALPEALQSVAAAASTPFYLVFTEDAEKLFGDGDADVRLVELIEHTIQTE
ncbi:MAG TPA: M67 family metallopeptidase [Caldilineaceae bacterium]|nr:M67 family metallopeptidase [Caldilineaceae bacterium]